MFPGFIIAGASPRAEAPAHHARVDAAQRGDEQHDRRTLQRGRRARREAVRQPRPRTRHVRRARRARPRHRHHHRHVLPHPVRRARRSSRRSAPRSSTARREPRDRRVDRRRDDRRLLRLRRPDLHTAHPAHERPGRRPDRARVVRARVRSPRLPRARSPSDRARSTSSTPRAASSFDHVWFRHPSPSLSSLASLEERAPGTAEDADEPSEWILHDVSFEVEPGELVALVGPSGAGKTTTAMLVPRIYDVNDGKVTVDGHDVRDLTLHSLRAAVGHGHAGPAPLPRRRSRENLRFAQPDATDDELVAACTAARIHDLIVGRCPTATTRSSASAATACRVARSSGSRSRACCSKDPAIVILDEATSHLDSESEHAIQRALADALRGRTAIVIAHRLSTIVDADRILVIDDGRIVEQGTSRRPPAARAGSTPTSTAPSSTGTTRPATRPAPKPRPVRVSSRVPCRTGVDAAAPHQRRFGAPRPRARHGRSGGVRSRAARDPARTAAGHRRRAAPDGCDRHFERAPDAGGPCRRARPARPATATSTPAKAKVRCRSPLTPRGTPAALDRRRLARRLARPVARQHDRGDRRRRAALRLARVERPVEPEVLRLAEARHHRDGPAQPRGRRVHHRDQRLQPAAGHDTRRRRAPAPAPDLAPP